MTPHTEHQPRDGLAAWVMRRLRRIDELGAAPWVAWDFTAAAGVYTLASIPVWRLHSGAHGLIGAGLVALTVVIAGQILGLYDKRVLAGRIRVALLVLESTVAGVLVVTLYANLVLAEPISRWALIRFTVGFLAVAIPPRWLAHSALRLYKTRVLAVADRARSERLWAMLQREENCYLLAGSCFDPGGEGLDLGVNEGLLSDLPLMCQALEIDKVVVTEDYLGRPGLLPLCFEAARQGCEIVDESTFCEEFLEQIPPNLINDSELLHAPISRQRSVALIAKRLMDIVISVTFLVVASPLLALIWVALRLTSSAPPIYRQQRAGRFGKPFDICKFRTMIPEAENDGLQWAQTEDPRVTRLGRILRKSRFDELPQFWNILKGEMSCVGPRPERPELVRVIEEEVPAFSYRHWARPGLTGLAQIRFRYSRSVEDAEQKLRYDLYYLKNWSLRLDLQIGLRTFSVLMRGAL